MTAREKFKLGKKVWLTREAHKMGICNRKNMHTGLVMGFGKDTMAVRVRVDGQVSTNSYHMNFWSHNNRE